MVDRSNREHLTEVQALCTGDEPEFVAGSIYGLREWFFYDGSFAPVDLETEPGHPTMVGHFNKPWDVLKTAVGTCYAPPVVETTEVLVPAGTDAEDTEFLVRSSASSWFEKIFTENTVLESATARLSLGFATQGLGNGQYLRQDSYRAADWILDDPFDGTKNIQVPMNFRRAVAQNLGVVVLRLNGVRREHRTGHPGCTCGIYAYHNLESLRAARFAGNHGVYGLINAYGHVTVGTKGFRAEKADVVALTRPRVDLNRPRSLREQIDETTDSWLDHGIILLEGLQELLTFAERGGYLTPADELRPDG